MSLAAFVSRLTRAMLSWWVRVPYLRTIVLVAVSVLVCSVFVVGQGTHPAFAIQGKPATDWSFYMSTTSTSTAYTLGCNQGHFDASSPPRNSEVVLDFGGQNSSGSGTLMINGVSISNAQIEAVSEQFSYGYWVCTGSDTTSQLQLGIGTNNSYYDVSSSGGSAWGNVVAAVRNYDHSNGYDAQVYVGGANDMEPGFGSASGTIAWAQGYAGVSNSAFYLNYGSADGCPTNSSGNGSCNNGWNQYDVWYVSWGSPPALPTPEIYYSANAQQWAMISLYGAQHQGGRVYMQGPWDEYDLDTSTNTSTTAWNELWTDLNNNSQTTQSMSYSLEIHRE